MPLNVIVVGAGVAGLTTAVALTHSGHRVTVVEQGDDTPPAGALSVWPNALAALDRLGLGVTVRAAGHPVRTASLRAPDGRWLHRCAPDLFTRGLGEPMIAVERARLREILIDALGSASVHYGLPVRGTIESERHVRVQWEGGESSADLVVGADGLDSLLAVRMCGPLDRRYSGTVAWRGIADIGVPAHFAGRVHGDGASFGIAPMGRDRTYWFAMEPTAAAAQPPADSAGHLDGLFASWPEPVADLIAATPGDLISRTPVYDREMARRWTRGRVVLVGDAVHPLRPYLGLGACQGIEDAVILADRVGEGTDLVGGLARYADFRHRRVRRIVTESKVAGRVFALGAARTARLLEATRMVPDRVFLRHLASVAGYSAFTLGD